ncbi:MAG: hypothetical protein JST37_12285 [Bacteroidetes bacterium]|nr:hypothetical protein [Bacteroidota bacterium]
MESVSYPLRLVLFSVKKIKKANGGEHYRPIAITSAQAHHFVNANDKKNHRK